MKANDRQVGGDHYKNESGFEHWDLASRVGMSYLVGTATKYVARWRKAKHPVQDLEKALHYVEKLIEDAPILVRCTLLPEAWVDSEVCRFCSLNGLGSKELEIFLLLALWDHLVDLEKACDLIEALLSEAKGKAEPPVPEPVPATDSNKHAERV